MSPVDCDLGIMQVEWEPNQNGLECLDGHGAWVAGSHGEKFGVIEAMDSLVVVSGVGVVLSSGDRILHDAETCREGRSQAVA